MADETQSPSKDGGGKNMQWMYEGAKSVVNREDYLLGKKIDKNFEMFSDVVVHDQEEEKRDAFFQQSLLKPSTSAHTAPRARNQHKVSALDTRIVRTEDPLVALKFQEEQRRRQLLENPLLKLKAQRVLRKAFEKELKKAVKKKSSKRKKRKRSSSPSSSSSSSSTSSPSPERRKEEEQQKRRHHHHHRRSEGRKSGDSEREGRAKRSSRNSSRTERHRRRRSSAGSSRRRRSRDRSRETTTADRGRDEESRARKNGSANSTMAPPTTTQPKVVPPKKLTAEELEERRRAMLTNASWRDDMRERNVRDAADKLRKEQDEMANHRGGAGFMRPMMNTATEDASIEKRLQSNRMNIQRQHDHMDKSFVRK